MDEIDIITATVLATAVCAALNAVADHLEGDAPDEMSELAQGWQDAALFVRAIANADERVADLDVLRERVKASERFIPDRLRAAAPPAASPCDECGGEPLSCEAGDGTDCPYEAPDLATELHPFYGALHPRIWGCVRCGELPTHPVHVQRAAPVEPVCMVPTCGCDGRSHP